MWSSLFGNLLRLVPKNFLSYLTGLLVHVKLPQSLSVPLIKAFAKFYKIDVSEAERPIEDYASIGDFFVRRLKNGARPIGSGLIHPVDGRLTEVGSILGGRLYQAKGKYYSCSDLLGDKDFSSQLEGGIFLTYYLCPRDYHRVHSPMDGQVFKVNHLPGRLWPVNPWSVTHISQLFSVNERLAVFYETNLGPVALVMVGATNVGHMTLEFDPQVVTNQRYQPSSSVYNKSYGRPISMAKGQELGAFHMGSTVLVLYPKGVIGHPVAGHRDVKMGESLILTEWEKGL